MIQRQEIKDVADAAGGMLMLGVWAEVIPAVLGILGVLWFILRFINFVRVNMLKLEPWLFN